MRILLISISLFILLTGCGPFINKKDQCCSTPKTLESAVNNILLRMDSQSKIEVKNTPRNELYKFYMGWGTGIRNNFGLWRGNNELITSSCGTKECDPEAASMVIICGVWNSLNNRPIREGNEEFISPPFDFVPDSVSEIEESTP
jgi:hypothetical protein